MVPDVLDLGVDRIVLVSDVLNMGGDVGAAVGTAECWVGGGLDHSSNRQE